MTLGKSWLSTFIVQVFGIHSFDFSSEGRAASQYDSFSGKMVLKRSCVSGTGEHSTLHIYCSGLLEDRALSHSPRRQSFQQM